LNALRGAQAVYALIKLADAETEASAWNPLRAPVHHDPQRCTGKGAPAMIDPAGLAKIFCRQAWLCGDNGGGHGRNQPHSPHINAPQQLTIFNRIRQLLA
jgi:hypothetical protein